MKKFYRIKDESLAGGVCAGIANYFNIPDWVWLIRLLFILFITNISIIIYLILWVITDEKESEQ